METVSTPSAMEQDKEISIADETVRRPSKLWKWDEGDGGEGSHKTPHRHEWEMYLPEGLAWRFTAPPVIMSAPL